MPSGGVQAGHRADIYSIGVALYQFLSGKLPYEGLSVSARSPKDALLVILEDPGIPLQQRNHAIPAEPAEVVTQAIQKTSAYRFESAASAGLPETAWGQAPV